MKLTEITSPPRPENLEYLTPASHSPGDGGWAELENWKYTREIDGAEVIVEFRRLIGQEDKFAMDFRVDRGDRNRLLGRISNYVNAYRIQRNKHDQVGPILHFVASALSSFLRDGDMLTTVNLVTNERFRLFLMNSTDYIRRALRPYGKTLEWVKFGKDTEGWTIYSPGQDPTFDVGSPLDSLRLGAQDRDIARRGNGGSRGGNPRDVSESRLIESLRRLLRGSPTG